MFYQFNSVYYFDMWRGSCSLLLVKRRTYKTDYAFLQSGTWCSADLATAVIFMQSLSNQSTSKNYGLTVLNNI